MPWPHPSDPIYPEPYRRWMYQQTIQEQSSQDIETWIYAGGMARHTDTEDEARDKWNLWMIRKEVAWRRQGEAGPFR